MKLVKRNSVTQTNSHSRIITIYTSLPSLFKTRCKWDYKWDYKMQHFNLMNNKIINTPPQEYVEIQNPVNRGSCDVTSDNISWFTPHTSTISVCFFIPSLNLLLMSITLEPKLIIYVIRHPRPIYSVTLHSSPVGYSINFSPFLVMICHWVLHNPMKISVLMQVKKYNGILNTDYIWKAIL